MLFNIIIIDPFERISLAVMLKTDFGVLGGSREAVGQRRGLMPQCRWDGGGFHSFGNSELGKKGHIFEHV